MNLSQYRFSIFLYIFFILISGWIGESAWPKPIYALGLELETGSRYWDIMTSPAKTMRFYLKRLSTLHSTDMNEVKDVFFTVQNYIDNFQRTQLKIAETSELRMAIPLMHLLRKKMNSLRSAIAIDNVIKRRLEAGNHLGHLAHLSHSRILLIQKILTFLIQGDVKVPFEELDHTIYHIKNVETEDLMSSDFLNIENNFSHYWDRYLTESYFSHKRLDISFEDIWGRLHDAVALLILDQYAHSTSIATASREMGDGLRKVLLQKELWPRNLDPMNLIHSIPQKKSYTVSEIMDELNKDIENLNELLAKEDNEGYFFTNIWPFYWKSPLPIATKIHEGYSSHYALLSDRISHKIGPAMSGLLLQKIGLIQLFKGDHSFMYKIKLTKISPYQKHHLITAEDLIKVQQEYEDNVSHNLLQTLTEKKEGTSHSLYEVTDFIGYFDNQQKSLDNYIEKYPQVASMVLAQSPWYALIIFN